MVWVLGLQPDEESTVSPRPTVSFPSAYWEACAGDGNGPGLAGKGRCALTLPGSRGDLRRPAALLPDTVHAQDAGPPESGSGQEAHL